MTGQVDGRICYILVECGINCSFMSKVFVRRWGLLINCLCGYVEMADGRVLRREVKFSRMVMLQLKQYKERIQFTVTDLKNDYDFFLGIFWLKDYNSAVVWSGKELILRC